MSTTSICLITLEEFLKKDGYSDLEIQIESRLPDSLDLILDRNTLPLFDQDLNNPRLFSAHALDKISILGILSCVRNMGWIWATSNSYNQNDVVVRKFYFEKGVDLSKIVLTAPLAKRRSNRQFHFDPPTKDSNSVSKVVDFNPPSQVVDQDLSLPPETTLRPALKARRSSIAEGKPSIVFKQMAEKRKLAISHPLDKESSATPPNSDPTTSHSTTGCNGIFLLTSDHTIHTPS